MRQGRISLVVTLAAVVASCSPQPAAGPTKPPAPGPAPAVAAKAAEAAKPAFDFEAILRREAPPLAVTKIQNAVLSAEVEAAAPPEVKNDKGFIHVAIPIGTAATLQCWVYDEQKDPANTMWSVAEGVKKEENIEVRLFSATDVFVAGEHAAFASHAIYLTGKEPERAAGELKLVYYNHPLVPTVCMHDEAGYTATVKRILTRFFATARRSDRVLQGKPVSWEVSVVKLNGQPVGAEDHQTYEHAATHLKTSVAFSSTLYPRSAVSAMPEDSVTSSTFDAAGALLDSTYVKGSGNEVDLKVELKRLSPAHYTFAGSKSGKPISGKFQTVDKRGLATDATISADVKRLLLGNKAKSFETEEYSPSVDPTAPMKTLYELESREARRVRVSYGPIRLVAVVDDEGQAKEVTGNIGSMTLTIERLGSGGKR